MKRSLISLAVAAVLVGLMSEVLVGSISEASKDIGLSEFFVGVFVVAIVGNAAEHWVAVLVAAKDKMDLAVGIAIGSSAQIALFVAPLLVLLSFVVGPNPLALVFNGYELAGLVFAVLIANFVTQDGESNWFEGAQLLALYAVLGPRVLLRLDAQPAFAGHSIGRLSARHGPPAAYPASNPRLRRRSSWLSTTRSIRPYSIASSGLKKRSRSMSARSCSESWPVWEA